MTEAARAIRPLVAGNWKMNGLQAQLAEAHARARRARRPRAARRRDDLPAGDAARAAGRGPSRGSKLLVGGQDCHAEAARRPHRRYLGRDAGGRGRRGRDRRPFGAARRPRRARPHGARARRRPRIAPGSPPSSASARRRASARPASRCEVVRRQLAGLAARWRATAANTVVAYEPVWAIGTGLTPTTADVARGARARSARRWSRASAPRAQAMRILYGGSVKPANARELIARRQRQRRARRRRQPQGSRLSWPSSRPMHTERSHGVGITASDARVAAQSRVRRNQRW